MIYKFISPLAVYLPRKTKEDKKCIINLNNFRNWSYHLCSDVKNAYNEAMRDQLEALEIQCPIACRYTYYKGRNMVSDRQNVLSMHEKFFMDALVKHGCIPDDSDEYLIESGPYRTGGIDRENPRVEIIVETV